MERDQCEMSLVNRLIDSVPFEVHLPLHRFAGPGTRLQERLAKGQRGINQLDEACRRHDIAYAQHKDLTHRRAADQVLSREAGRRFQDSNASFGERAAAAVVKTAMVLKRKIGAGLKRRGAGTRVSGKKIDIGVRRKVGGGRRASRRARGRPRAIPLARRGGFLAPLAAAVSAGLSGVKAIRDMSNARKLVEE